MIQFLFHEIINEVYYFITENPLIICKPIIVTKNNFINV